MLNSKLAGWPSPKSAGNGVKSGWWSVISVVPQGSVFGLMLLNIFISDLHKGIECILSKLVDDTKIGSVNLLGDMKTQQKDVDRANQ